MNRLLAILFFIFTAASSWRGSVYAVGEDSPAIKAEVTPDKATVGEPLTYRIYIPAGGPRNISIIPPEKREYYPDKKKSDQRQNEKPGDTKSDPSQFIPLYVIHSLKKDDRSEKVIADITVTLQISYYRPGTYSLPELEIRGPDGTAIGYKVPTVDIKPVNEKGEFQDIEPPLMLGGNYTRLIIFILGLAALVAGGFFAYRYFKKKYNEKKTITPPVPPIDVFMKDVEILEGDALIDNGKIEEFVFGISMIFRKFLSLQFGFDATEMTTYEIEKKLGKIFSASMYDKHFNMIMQSLNLWDLSKFAEFAPSREMLHANLEKTVSLAKDLSGDMSNVVPGF